MLRYGKIQRLTRNGKPTRTYFVRTYDPVSKKRGWKTTGCSSIRAAEQWVKTQELEEAKGPGRRAQEEAQGRTFAQAVAAWLSDKDGTVSERHFKSLESRAELFWNPAFGKDLLTDVRAEQIQSYLKRRKAGTLLNSKKKLRAISVNQDRRDLNTFFNWCLKRNWITENPIHAVSRVSGEVKRRRKYLSKDEEARLLKACGESPVVKVKAKRNKGGRRGGKVTDKPAQFKQKQPRPDWLYPLVLTALRCGFRRGTLLSLHWRDIDLESKCWRIPGEKMKSGRDYDAPTPISVAQALEAYRGELAKKCKNAKMKRSDRLGPQAKMFGLSDKTNLRKPFLSACKAARLELTFHDLRGCFLNRCAEAGIDIGVAMRLSDHTTVSVVLQHYRQVRYAELEKAVGAMEISP